MMIPNWPPKDWRAILALVASVAGAVALTAVAIWQTWILAFGQWSVINEALIIRYLGMAHLTTLFGVLAVLLSLGLAINRRTVKFSRDGFEATSDDLDQ